MDLLPLEKVPYTFLNIEKSEEFKDIVWEVPDKLLLMFDL